MGCMSLYGLILLLLPLPINVLFFYWMDNDPKRDLAEWTTHGNRVLASKSEIYQSRLLV